MLTAGKNDAVLATVALERLCTYYWHPVYSFIRRSGIAPHEAEDLTQSFFAYLLEKETIKRVDKKKGRFRSFLLAAISNFLANERDKARTLKRGGQREIISFDQVTGEGVFLKEPVDLLTPEMLFDRRWAAVLVDKVLGRLEREYVLAGKTNLFETLRPALTTEIEDGLRKEWAEKLGMTVGSIKVALHRMRRRFGELLRKEVAHTVATSDEIDQELRHLLAAIGR